MFMVMKPVRVVPALDVFGKDPESVLEPEAEQQVDDHVLEEDNRRAEPIEHLHLGVDEQGGVALDVFAGPEWPPRIAASIRPSSRKEIA